MFGAIAFGAAPFGAMQFPDDVAGRGKWRRVEGDQSPRSATAETVKARLDAIADDWGKPAPEAVTEAPSKPAAAFVEAMPVREVSAAVNAMVAEADAYAEQAARAAMDAVAIARLLEMQDDDDIEVLLLA